MNIERFTVISLRLCTSRVTPRWSVKVSWLFVVLRYRSWVLTLNFSRNGTFESSGFFQITIPSWYLSSAGLSCVTGVGGDEIPASAGWFSGTLVDGIEVSSAGDALAG